MCQESGPGKSADEMASGLSIDCVAEVIVELPGDGPTRRGSGYRVGAGAVLTAAHVVTGAERVWLRFRADRTDEWTAEAQVVLHQPEVDLAVLAIEPDGAPVPAVTYARLANADQALVCSAVGFPRFKLR